MFFYWGGGGEGALVLRRGGSSVKFDKSGRAKTVLFAVAGEAHFYRRE